MMLLPYDKLLGLQFEDRTFSYSERDTMLYALAVGMGSHLPQDLGFIYEKNLQALPTQATVIAWEDTWQEATGMDISKVVHGEQRVTLHQPLAPAGQIRSKFRIAEAFDKGPGKGAIILAETNLFEVGSNKLIATLLSSVFARGDGGFGGVQGKGPSPQPIPQRPADRVLKVDTRTDQAYIYRLCGDRNPLHVDPDFAKTVGFDRPILHGLCSWGMTSAAIVRSICDGNAARMTHFEARFTAPVYPGETLLVETWIESESISFRTRVAERGVVVLDYGHAKVTVR